MSSSMMEIYLDFSVQEDMLCGMMKVKKSGHIWIQGFDHNVVSASYLSYWYITHPLWLSVDFILFKTVIKYIFNTTMLSWLNLP